MYSEKGHFQDKRIFVHHNEVCVLGNPACMRRVKAIGFICLSAVITKIATLPHLGIRVTRTYNETVEIGEKLHGFIML